MRYLIVFLFALCFVACQQNDSIVPDVAKSSKEYSVSDKSVTRAIQTKEVFVLAWRNGRPI